MRDRVIDPTKKPASQRAEEAVLGALMRSEEIRSEILGSDLEAEHFYFRPYRMIYDEVVERYYADDAIDPLSLAEAVGPQIAQEWGLEEREAVDRIMALARPDPGDAISAREHAKIIKRHADYRKLLQITTDAMAEALDEDVGPDEIAGRLSAAATHIVTGAMSHSELLPYGDLGRRWTRATVEQIEAKAAGVDLGAVFGIQAVDEFVKGLRPTELMMLGGAAGVGKSGLGWAMGRGFAVRQLRKPEDRRIGTLVLSLEMGEEQSSSRFAQMESGIEGEKLRTASLTRMELREAAQKWANNRELPIVVNHSGALRESQIKALCVDAIRRHRVGLVIIDHFRFIKTDERFENKNDADDQVVSFLKGVLAKDLNLAVVCLAHTIKGEARRPVMDDLRGSGMISAFADVVSLLYWPWKGASLEKRERGLIAREEYELIHEKVRQSGVGTGQLWMDMSTMSIR